MSGHSHFSKIKHQKGAADVERGKIFSKIVNLITIAVREGGNIDENLKLKAGIRKAKEANMPASNIERAIKRGTGELEGMRLEEILFEAYGPGNVAFIIETITDNRNRAVAEIKQILSKNNGKLATDGSVKWLFKRKGVAIVKLNEQEESLKDKEKLELTAIDAGADDILWDDDVLQVYSSVDELENMKQKLEGNGIKIGSTGIDWLAKNEISVSEEKRKATEKLFFALDETDFVQDIYSNLAS